MKLRLVSTSNLKALDIDLKLNNPSKENISEVMKEISNDLSRYNFELGLNLKGETKEDRDSLISIPNEAKIKRIEVDDQKKLRKLSFQIRSDQKENTYVFMNQEDEVVGMYVDGQSITRGRSSLPQALQKANYILVIKRSDLEKTKAKREERVKAESESFQLRRDKRRQKDLAKLQTSMSRFQNSVEQYKKVISEDDPEESVEQAPRDLLTKEIKELKKGDLFFTTVYPSKDSEYYEILKDWDELEELSRQGDEVAKNIPYRSYKLVNGKITGEIKKDNQSARVGSASLVYVWDPEKKEAKKDDFEIESFVPDLNFKDLLRKDAVFPANAFPIERSRTARNIVNNLKDEWQIASDLVSKIKGRGFDPSRALERYQNAIEQGKRIYEDMSFVDKSGYEVDLGKYFDKLAEMPTEVPKSVKDKYTEVFNYITKESKKLDKKVKGLLEKDDIDYQTIVNMTSFLRDFGPKKFNNEYEKYLSIDYHDRKSSVYDRPRRHIERFENFKTKFIQNYEKL